MKNFFWKISTVAVLLTADQITKFFALHFLKNTVQVFPFFSLRLAQNTGIAFSFPFPTVLLLTVTGFLMVGIAWIVFQKKNVLDLFSVFSFLLILSGGIGNFIDRILRGFVVDFLSFWNFPIFNLADVCISVGVILLLWMELGKKKK